MRVMVRKAAKLAVYEEMTMRANIHQTPIIIRVARVVYGTSPPRKKEHTSRQKCLMHSSRKHFTVAAAVHRHQRKSHRTDKDHIWFHKSDLRDTSKQTEPQRPYLQDICDDSM